MKPLSKIERDRLAHTIALYIEWGFVNELAAYRPFRRLTLNPFAVDRYDAVRRRIAFDNWVYP